LKKSRLHWVELITNSERLSTGSVYSANK
jgi:hypothetical protein